MRKRDERQNNEDKRVDVIQISMEGRSNFNEISLIEIPKMQARKAATLIISIYCTVLVLVRVQYRMKYANLEVHVL
jgi:hypothetical protein